ncbi:MAG: alpha/beta fold hydrolase [Solirubrobacteraceae bacterium]
MAHDGRAIETFTSWDGLEIAYRRWGQGDGLAPAVVLHHGFVADADSNWVAPGVVKALVAAGREVLAPDARGHGRSQKPHDPRRYGEQRMARDLGVLIELVGASQVDLVGYSMGAVVSLIFAVGEERVRRLVVGGVGSGVLECGGVDRRAVSNEAIIHALSVDDPLTLERSPALALRRLADALGADRRALVAQARSIYRGQIALARIAAPTLVLAGDSDPLALRPEVLVAALADARLQMLRGNHMQAIADPGLARAIVEFLR